MKDAEMHKGLPNSELRDYVSLTLSTPLETEKEDWTGYRPDMTMMEHCLFHMKQQERVEKNAIKAQKYWAEKCAMHSILEKFGWESIDVSEHIVRSGDRYKNFIGTREELTTLMKGLGIEYTF